MTKKMKWRCKGCKEEFVTKKECTQHIKDKHWDFINKSAGLGSFLYQCEKI